MTMKRVFFVLFLGFVFFVPRSEAAFVDRQRAWQIAESWLSKSGYSRESDNRSETHVKEIVHYKDGGEVYGNPGYYIAFLDPSGWLCIPADDRLEPVRAFGKALLTQQNHENSPLRFLLKVHLPQRRTALNLKKPLPMHSTGNKRWDFLALSSLRKDTLAARSGIGMNEISNDIVVPPLLKENSWGQGGLPSSPSSEDLAVFYNKHVAWNGRPYLVGDVPLSLGQFMRCLSWGTPQATLGRITLNGVASIEPVVRLGAGYDWSAMELEPKPNGYSQNAQNEIATLLHDTGVLLNADYNAYWKNGQTVYETFAELYKVPSTLTRNLGYRNAIYAPYHFSSDGLEERRHLDRIVNPNLVSGTPVFLGISLFDGDPGASSLLKKHTALIDGLAFQDYGPGNDRVPYHHINFGWNGQNNELWFALSDAIQMNALGLIAQPPCDFVFNVMSDDSGKELIGGRFYLGNKVMDGVAVGLKTEQGQAFSATTDARGAFWARIPSNTVIKDIDFFKKDIFLRVPSLSAHTLLGTDELASAHEVGQSESWRSVGNRWWGDLTVRVALADGVVSGVAEGLKAKQIFFASSFASRMGQWNFEGLTGLYAAAFPYDRYIAQPWLYPFLDKVEQFVRSGGTVYVEADSWIVASRLASAGGGTLVFYGAHEVPVYAGAGMSRIFPKGALLDDLGMDQLTIPFTPYVIGSGGPLIKSIAIPGVAMLASAEVTLFTGNDAFTRIYPVSFTFPLGKGRVYYSSFPIPESTASSAARFLGDWYLSRPLKNIRSVSGAVFSRENNLASAQKGVGGEAGGGCNGGMFSVLCLVLALSSIVEGRSRRS